MPVDAALTEARLQIFLDDKNNLEWATPILYMQIPDGQLFEFKGPRPKSLSANLDDVIGSELTRTVPEKASEANARWKDRLYQFGNWFTSTPEVQYQPPPGAKPDPPATETDVFDKGRQVWNDWFGSRKTSGPVPPKVKPRTLPAAEPPAPTQTRPPVIPAPTPTPTRSDPAPRLQTPTPPPSKPQPQEPQLQHPRTQPPLATTGTSHVSPRAESRIYQTPLVPAFLADTIRQYFISQGCESQVLQKGAVWVSQGRKKQVDVRASVGLAATIVIERSGASLRVSIGGGPWVEPGMALGGDPVATLITGPIAMDPQRTLIRFLWDIVDTHVTRSGGCRIA
jgi:hypothetical protein